MNAKHAAIALLSLALLLVAACKPKDGFPVKNEGLLATVNGAEITEDELFLKLQGGHGVTMTPEARQRALDELITEELLYQKGVKLGLDRDVKYRNAVRVMEQRVKAFKRAEMARHLRSTRIAATVAITQEDVNSYYDEHVSMISADLHLLGIKFPDEVEAQAAYDRIQSGADFETIARERTARFPKENNVPWDMGFLHWSQVPLEWTESLYALEKGETSAVLSSKRSGIYILKLVGKRKNPDAARERVSAALMNRLQDLRISDAYERYVDQLKREARIVKQEERRKTS